MAEGQKYVFALNKDKPDFVGEYVGVENGFLMIRNPMIVEYRKDFSVSFSTDFLPATMPPRYDRALTAHVPVASMHYFVMLAEDDAMIVSYLEELAITPDKAVPQ